MRLIHSTLLKLVLLLFSITAYQQLAAQDIDKSRLLEDLRYLSSDELEGRKTLSEGSLKARKHIRQRFQQLGLTSQFSDHTQNFTFTNRRDSTVYENAANIIGFIAGSESAKMIVVTAHYDHLGEKDGEIFNGADDNASGTAALMAMAEYFSKNRPKYSMMFAALDAEEMGLQGAKALIADFPFPLEQIILNINMDMISRSEAKELYASGTYHTPALLQILQRVDQGLPISLKFGHDDPSSGPDDWTFSSDHGPFHMEKIPHIYFGVEDHEDYHKSTDTFENIDQEFYYNAVNVILRALIALDAQL